MANIGSSGGQVRSYDGSTLTRRQFPSDFLFGAATSAFQVEGAYATDGKGLSTWDVLSLQNPEKIADGSNGSLAIDHYNQFKEDVKLMKKTGLDTYRLSIAWTRILPSGRLNTGVNREGVKFYNHLIDLLLSEGIKPFVTLFHFDTPHALQSEYGGFLSANIVEDFSEYADVCFFEFGDRVKFWITENEPWTLTINGYVNTGFPPFRGSALEHPRERNNVTPRCNRATANTCAGGNPGTEPYIVAHNLLLAHAAAVDIYRRNYQAVQEGKIGVTNMSMWFDPYDATSPNDIAAASRAVDFMWGWFVEPIVTGNYPRAMLDRVGDRLPVFTAEQSNLLKGSFDFIGMNYYTTNLAANKPTPPGTPPTYYTDQEVQFYTTYPNGIPIGEQAASEWLYIVPSGIYMLLKHNMKEYGNPLVYITENGVDERNDPTLPDREAIEDNYRIKFYQDHLAYVKQAIDEGVNVKGFILWSLFDNFEWTAGYTVRFGIYYVKYANRLLRHPKNSAIWFMNFLKGNALRLPPVRRRAVEAQAVEAQVVEAQAGEAQVVEAQAAEAQAVEAQVVEAQSAEAQIVEAQAAEAQVVEAQAVEAGSSSVKRRSKRFWFLSCCKVNKANS